MGAVSIDLHKSERKLSNKYPMHTKEGIEAFLTNYNYIKSLVYSQADFDALIMLIDFERALIGSKLSDMELITLVKVFIEDKKRVDVAKEFDVTKQTVQNWVSRATGKLAKFYEESGDTKNE